jgi:hypothetical protein
MSATSKPDVLFSTNTKPSTSGVTVKNFSVFDELVDLTPQPVPSVDNHYGQTHSVQAIQQPLMTNNAAPSPFGASAVSHAAYNNTYGMPSNLPPINGYPSYPQHSNIPPYQNNQNFSQNNTVYQPPVPAHNQPDPFAAMGNLAWGSVGTSAPGTNAQPTTIPNGSYAAHPVSPSVNPFDLF